MPGFWMDTDKKKSISHVNDAQIIAYLSLNQQLTTNQMRGEIMWQKPNNHSLPFDHTSLGITQAFH